MLTRDHTDGIDSFQHVALSWASTRTKCVISASSLRCADRCVAVASGFLAETDWRLIFWLMFALSALSASLSLLFHSHDADDNASQCLSW